jgi:hypothetical protein
MNADYLQKYSKRNIFILSLHLSPYYLYHFFFIPFRKNIKEINYKLPKKSKIQKRHLAALFDAMLNILLEGYIEITGEKINSSTGQMLYFLFEITMALDEYLDKHRKTNSSLSIKEVLEDLKIKNQINIFRNFIRLFDREESIISYLKEMFTAHYEHYIRLIKIDVNQLSFTNALEISQIDGGWTLSSTMEIVRLFNMHKPNQKMLHEFYLLGTAGKFAEDMVDLACDKKNGHLNLFLSLIKQRPTEETNLYKQIESEGRIDFKWLNKNCNKTFIEYTNLLETYYNQITSPKVRLACDLSMIPAFLGHDWDPERHAAS